MDAAEIKKLAAQLFTDIYRADVRLHVVDLRTLTPLVDAAVTFDMNGKVVFQGANLYEALLARRMPQEALVQALLVLEPRAAKLNVPVRQPPALLRIAPEQRQALVQTAPRSSSPFLEELEHARTPQILHDAKKAPKRRRFVFAAAAVVAIGLGALTVVSLPKGLTDANVTFPPNAMPCERQRAAHGILFCVVDVDRVDKETDLEIRARMKASKDAAVSAGYDKMAFMRPGTGPDGEEHRFRPFLWERDPLVDTGSPFGVGKKKAPAPGAP